MASQIDDPVLANNLKVIEEGLKRLDEIIHKNPRFSEIDKKYQQDVKNLQEGKYKSVTPEDNVFFAEFRHALKAAKSNKKKQIILLEKELYKENQLYLALINLKSLYRLETEKATDLQALSGLGKSPSLDKGMHKKLDDYQAELREKQNKQIEAIKNLTKDSRYRDLGSFIGNIINSLKTTASATRSPSPDSKSASETASPESSPSPSLSRSSSISEKSVESDSSLEPTPPPSKRKHKKKG